MTATYRMISVSFNARHWDFDRFQYREACKLLDRIGTYGKIDEPLTDGLARALRERRPFLSMPVGRWDVQVFLKF